MPETLHQKHDGIRSRPNWHRDGQPPSPGSCWATSKTRLTDDGAGCPRKIFLSRWSRANDNGGWSRVGSGETYASKSLSQWQALYFTSITVIAGFSVLSLSNFVPTVYFGMLTAMAMGLANRLVPDGQSRQAAEQLARELSQFPQTCLRHDRLSAYEQWSMTLDEALANELQHGLQVLESRETLTGARRFAGGKGRHGSFSDL